MWLMYVNDNEGLIFNNFNVSKDRANISISGANIVALVCWFGVNATKYANITNIPPT